MSEISEFYATWRILKTIFEMCTDRGYMVSHLLLDQTLEEFKEKYKNSLPSKQDLIYTFKHSFIPNDKICVFFSIETVSNNEVRSIMSRMEELKVNKAVVVLSGEMKITPGARKLMEESAPEFFFDCFLESELLVNITHHELVPEHQVLSQDEAQNVLLTYKAKQSQLPRILKSDPICRYFSMRPGQIVKITRKSETAGIYVTYRIVY